MKTQYQHPELSRFAELAEAFCQLLEKDEDSAAHQLREVHLLLPQLYASALRLPAPTVLFSDEDENDDDEDADEVPNVEGEELSKSAAIALPAVSRLGEFLGHRAAYREVFDPHDWSGSEGSEEVAGSVLDDLSDIYLDLRRGLLLWRDGASGKALWEWRFNFEVHWGEHATGALRALYTLSAWHDMAWPSGSATSG